MPRLSDHQWEYQNQILKRRIESLERDFVRQSRAHRVNVVGLGAIALLVVSLMVYDLCF